MANIFFYEIFFPLLHLKWWVGCRIGSNSLGQLKEKVRKDVDKKKIKINKSQSGIEMEKKREKINESVK